MNTLPKNLKRLRLAKEWTQEKLAKRSKINVAAISHYETGRREPNRTNLEKLRKALGCTWEELMK